MPFKTLADLVTEARASIREVLPDELADAIEAGEPWLIVDIREPYEYERVHVPGSVLIPRGLLEGAAEASRSWQRAVLERHPQAWVYALPVEGRGLPQALAGKCGHPTAPDRVVAFLCSGTSCAPPEYDLPSLLAVL